MFDQSLTLPGLNKRLAPAPGVNLAAYRGEVVALVVSRDEYVALGPGVSAAVRWALNPQDTPEPSNACKVLEPLVATGLLVPAPADGDGIRLAEPAEPGGVASYRWMPHLSEAARLGAPATFWQTMRALTAIMRADRVLRRGRLAGILVWLRRRRSAFRASAAGPGNTMMVAAVISAHIRARMLYPRVIQCLTGSAALAADAWAMGLPVGFVIGVQKYPFVSHAWVELSGRVLNDQDNVARRLAPIVSIPVTHGCS